MPLAHPLVCVYSVLTVQVGVESVLEVLMALQLSSHVVVEEACEDQLPHAQQLEFTSAQVRLVHSVCAQPVQRGLCQEEECRDVDTLQGALVQGGDEHIQAV